MDYKALLEKYMKHVIQEEGVSFLEPVHEDVDISEEERNGLFTLEERIYLAGLSEKLSFKRVGPIYTEADFAAAKVRASLRVVVN